LKQKHLIATVVLAALTSPVNAENLPLEGPIDPFLGQPQMEIQQLFKTERFPNIVATRKGTVLATWGSTSVRALRSEDGGKTWGEEITIANPGFQGGGTTVDETTGDILAFVEEKHPPAPLAVYRSKDDGLTWQVDDATFHPDANGNVLSMSMNEHGITLRHGKHKGRLLRPARHYGAGNRPVSLFPTHYTSAVYSDDGGKTWYASASFSECGTGEAAVAELSDGRVYYNSRRHWAPEGKSPLWRWTAWSDDGGATWSKAKMSEILPDGPQSSEYGCMGGLVRLPVAGKDILLYSNCDTPIEEGGTTVQISGKGRRNGTVWVSFDGGKTWPLKRLVTEKAFAYSAMGVGRPGTPSEGWIYLHFEGGGSKVARFNLSWVLGGKPTGDGTVPEGLRP